MPANDAYAAMTKPTPTDVGARVKILRKSAGLALNDLAERSALSKGYLSELENGAQRNPTLDALHRLARSLGVTIADLVGEPPVVARLDLPPALPKGLEELIKERRKAGTPLDHETVAWLAHAQFRGKRPREKGDFEYLLRALRVSTPEDDPGT